MQHMISAKLLQTKQHYEILDGLRGIAALGIVVFHFMEWVYPDYTKNFIGHGFLAVDFFFCLSGFVIGYAYDSRIDKLGIKEFFKSRMIRLHPLVIAGTILGLLGFLFDPFFDLPSTYTIGKIALVFLASLFLVPLPIMPERGFNLFSFNAPSWSLFWEYAANIIYAIFLYKAGRKTLFLIAVVAALFLGYTSYHAGNLMGGWSGDNFWDGGVRVAYSFTAGLLVYRFQWIIKNSFGFVILAMLLCASFIMPWLKWNWLMEWLVVVLFFPLIVSLGAGSFLSKQLKPVCRFSGNLSYPLYMTHYCAIWIFGNYLTDRHPSQLQITFIIVCGTILLVAFAWLVMALYDVPVRKWLAGKREAALRAEVKT